MKAKILFWMFAMMVLTVPTIFAVNVGTGVGVGINTEDYAPQVFMCDHRVMLDDATEPGRVTLSGQSMTERTQNYAFEGEQIQWEVMVFDKNGIQKVSDVYGTVGDTQGAGNPIEVNCDPITLPQNITITLAGTTAHYLCTLTVETPISMYGEHWVTVEVTDLDGLTGTMDENEYWFLNPVVALSIEGSVGFSDVRPGTASYSDTILVGNDADDGSGVLLDMFISGTDFYDSSSSGGACPDTNKLSLSAFRYFATNGAYSTATDLAVGARSPAVGDERAVDAEGYVNIGYGIGFNDPTPFYDGFEIIQGPKVGPGAAYYSGNILSPGSEHAITFRLMLPEPCNGDYDSGAIYFWGEAI